MMMNPGIIAALITPLNDDETVDVPSLARVIDRAITGGVVGLFVGGTIGEGPALCDSERFALVRESVRIARKRVPVLANVSDVGTVRACRQAHMAAEAGADVLVATARFAFPQRLPAETHRHIQSIASASKIPVWFYENPSTTMTTGTFDQLRQIVAISNVAGLKYSAADRNLFARCVEVFQPTIPVMTGNVGDIAFAAGLGAVGAVSGIASLLPDLCVRVFECARRQEVEKARRLQEDLDSVYEIYGGQGMPYWPSAQKHILKRLGVIRHSYATAPFLRLEHEDEIKIEEAFARIQERIQA